MASDSDSDDLEALNSNFRLDPWPAETGKKKKRRLDINAIQKAGWQAVEGLENDFAEKETMRAAEKRAENDRAVEAQRAAEAESEAARAAADEEAQDDTPAGSTASAGSKEADLEKKKHRSYNQKETRSRKMRGENDYVQEEKRLLRQGTDGYSMGY
ncbi:hypothetical protein M885DRAFT_586079 [Pelagophyceae sp. CCMP2097]|nr:hypothetical protein M885DRAFT_586079 [Pelagophyceae sp. CCMP2097]